LYFPTTRDDSQENVALKRLAAKKNAREEPMNKFWFGQKSFLLIRLPCSWEGWLLYAAYVFALYLTIHFAGMIADGLVCGLVDVGVIMLLTVGMVTLLHERTEGGWRDD
jgi:hypothetical protein